MRCMQYEQKKEKNAQLAVLAFPPSPLDHKKNAGNEFIAAKINFYVPYKVLKLCSLQTFQTKKQRDQYPTVLCLEPTKAP